MSTKIAFKKVYNMNSPDRPKASPQAGSLRNHILAVLEQAGGWCSGEAISAHLGISRAAVGKHMAALRAEGHAIEAATRRGYKLLVRQDVIDGNAMAAKLQTAIVGKGQWHMLAETGSTNLEAVRLAAGGAEEGTVVFAERQTRGRGRKGDDWVSVPRGLQFSVIFRPDARWWNAEALTRLGGQAVARAVNETAGIRAAFRRPNDVYVANRKLAGILVETGYRVTLPEWAILGIGCNGNALPEDFPDAVRDSFTSVLREAGRPVSRPALLQAILEALDQAYGLMRQGEPAPE
jgi:BirA family biotin operon repressor/biotin-[acetyl-CoA-carboxylase] ligase